MRQLLKLLLFLLVTIPVYVFLVYSSTASVAPEDVETIDEYTSICEATSCQRQSEEPLIVRGTVKNGIGLRFAGFCTIEQDGCYAVCLMRGFPPIHQTQMNCVIIPRRLITIGGRCLFLCAVVAYQPSRISESLEE